MEELSADECLHGTSHPTWERLEAGIRKSSPISSMTAESPADSYALLLPGCQASGRSRVLRGPTGAQRRRLRDRFRAGEDRPAGDRRSSVHAAIPVELFFKRENHQRLVDVLAQQTDAPLTPGPELRTNVVDDWNTTLLHLASHSPVERRRIDNDGEVRLAFDPPPRSADETASRFWANG